MEAAPAEIKVKKYFLQLQILLQLRHTARAQALGDTAWQHGDGGSTVVGQKSFELATVVLWSVKIHQGLSGVCLIIEKSS